MSSENQAKLIALYGSLRRRQPTYEALGLDRQLRFVGPCILEGVLHDFGEWPGLIEGKGRVAGELFEVVSQEALTQLDDYEACDLAEPDCGLFVRRLLPLAEPTDTHAFAYVYNGDIGEAPIVPGGDWIAYLATRAAGKTG